MISIKTLLIIGFVVIHTMLFNLITSSNGTISSNTKDKLPKWALVVMAIPPFTIVYIWIFMISLAMRFLRSEVTTLIQTINSKHD